MDSPSRRRAAIFVLPMIICFVSARKAAPNVRAVDFLLLFASGVIFGVCLLGVIQLIRGSGRPPA
jgi:hypothetical protein